MTAVRTRHVSVVIDRPATAVYDYAADPANLPTWAEGLSTGIRQVGGRWLADSPMGEVEVVFLPRNDFGVLDHTVVLPSGDTVLNPMRVLGVDEDSAEVVFTLRRRPGMSDDEFTRDAEAVAADLATLKRVLEEQAPGQP